jgi:uncharacterized membrane protein YqaE (UPF0057 family)
MPTERAERWNKLDLKPKRWWGYTIFLFILGTLLPPLAVAARFGIGRDFWINVALTLCGYIPGHGHNFYIQNIRNNKSDRRTPKWAQKHGLVDMTALERRRKRAQWANRYNERAPRSTGTNGELWSPEEEQYYGKRDNRKSGRWNYPTNFEDVVLEADPPRKKKSKKDRWARTEDAYVMEAEATERRKRKKSKKKKSTVGEPDTHSRASGSTTEFPEDAEGGLYEDRANTSQPQAAVQDRTGEEAVFSHQF